MSLIQSIYKVIGVSFSNKTPPTQKPSIVSMGILLHRLNSYHETEVEKNFSQPGFEPGSSD